MLLQQQYAVLFLFSIYAGGNSELKILHQAAPKCTTPEKIQIAQLLFPSQTLDDELAMPIEIMRIQYSLIILWRAIATVSSW